MLELAGTATSSGPSPVTATGVWSVSRLKDELPMSAAALTIYDMAKAVDRGMTIGDVRLLEKRGGVHGDYVADETP